MCPRIYRSDTSGSPGGVPLELIEVVLIDDLARSCTLLLLCGKEVRQGCVTNPPAGQRVTDRLPIRLPGKRSHEPPLLEPAGQHGPFAGLSRRTQARGHRASSDPPVTDEPEPWTALEAVRMRCRRSRRGGSGATRVGRDCCPVAPPPDGGRAAGQRPRSGPSESVPLRCRHRDVADGVAPVDQASRLHRTDRESTQSPQPNATRWTPDAARCESRRTGPAPGGSAPDGTKITMFTRFSGKSLLVRAIWAFTVSGRG